MPTYQSPGVYMEEVDRGTKPIEAVGTAVAAFIGYTEMAEDRGESIVGKPTLVTNWSQYQQKFGGFIEGAYTPDSVYGYFANGGGLCYIVSIRTLGKSYDGAKISPAEATITVDGSKAKALAFKAQEGGPVGNNISVEIEHAPQLESGDDEEGDAKAKKGPALFDLHVKVDGDIKERYTSVSMDTKADRYVKTLVEEQSKLIFIEVNGKADQLPVAGEIPLEGGKVETKSITVSDYKGDVTKRVGLGGLEPFDDVTMIAVPDLMASYEAGEIDLDAVQAVQQSIIDYCEAVRYCFAILDTPPGLMPQEVLEWRRSVNYDTSYAALYYPWLRIADMTPGGGTVRRVPPSGYVAGVYANVDNTRGVHKAPANEIIRGILGVDLQMTKGENDLLNPNSINAIRPFTGRGTRIWGARTLSSNASWRYINVRRLFNMIEESIEKGTQWVVFEPNDPALWGRVKRDVGAFLKMVWRTGALYGQSPQQAFYVKCDEETNPPEARDLGQLVVEIGIAPVKPAEFVIFRVSQWSPEQEG